MSTWAAAIDYQNLLRNFSLVQHVTGPLRVINICSTLIDNIVSTPPGLVLSVKQAIELSDHCVQIADIDVALQRPPTILCLVHPLCKCHW